MKVSKMIEHLKFVEHTYGDIEVEMLHQDEEDKVIRKIDPIHFNYSQDEKGIATCTIQNFPY